MFQGSGRARAVPEESSSSPHGERQTVVVTPTASEVEAAKLRVALDRRLGVKSAAIVEKLATAKANQTFQYVVPDLLIGDELRSRLPANGSAVSADQASESTRVSVDPTILRVALEAALGPHAPAADPGYDVRFWSPDRKTEYLMDVKVFQRRPGMVTVSLAEKREGESFFRRLEPFELPVPDDLTIAPATSEPEVARH